MHTTPDTGTRTDAPTDPPPAARATSGRTGRRRIAALLAAVAVVGVVLAAAVGWEARTRTTAASRSLTAAPPRPAAANAQPHLLGAFGPFVCGRVHQTPPRKSQRRLTGRLPRGSPLRPGIFCPGLLSHAKGSQ